MNTTNTTPDTTDTTDTTNRAADPSDTAATLRPALPAVTLTNEAAWRLMDWAGDPDTAREARFGSIATVLSPGEDGYGVITARLVIDHDHDSSIYDEDECMIGELAEVRVSGYGYGTRPSHFDGSAFIVDRSRFSVTWCQPPPHVVGSPELLRTFRQWLINIAEEGYFYLGVQVRVDGETIAADYLGGIDGTTSAEELASIASDCAWGALREAGVRPSVLED